MARTKRTRAPRKAARKAETVEAYDPWEHRPERERARPTEERRARGMFRLVAGEDAGASYALDEASTPLRRAYADGAIDRGQLYAGERFEALARGSIPRGPRSCLDWMPPGSGEGETEYEVRKRRAWIEVCRHLGMRRSQLMLDVCVFHQATGPRRSDLLRWRLLDEALTMAREFWGMGTE